MGEQSEQMSIKMSELARAVRVERESQLEEKNCNRQEVNRSEKRLKEKKDEILLRNLSRRRNEREVIWSYIDVNKSRRLGLSIQG